MGISAEAAAARIRLVMLANDVSLRNLIPAELAKGFGFFQSKPSTAFSPVAVTPDELGAAWREAKLHRPLLVHLNGRLFGRPDAGIDMTFDFGRLIAHAARTRRLSAGSIIGSGTISNKEAGGPGRPAAEGGTGYACIAEQRSVETIRSRPAGDALSQIRRPAADRDAGGWRRQHLRRHRADRDAYFNNEDLTYPSANPMITCVHPSAVPRASTLFPANSVDNRRELSSGVSRTTVPSWITVISERLDVGVPTLPG